MKTQGKTCNNDPEDLSLVSGVTRQKQQVKKTIVHSDREVDWFVAVSRPALTHFSWEESISFQFLKLIINPETIRLMDLKRWFRHLGRAGCGSLRLSGGKHRIFPPASFQVTSFVFPLSRIYSLCSSPPKSLMSFTPFTCSSDLPLPPSHQHQALRKLTTDFQEKCCPLTENYSTFLSAESRPSSCFEKVDR